MSAALYFLIANVWQAVPTAAAESATNSAPLQVEVPIVNAQNQHRHELAKAIVVKHQRAPVVLNKTVARVQADGRIVIECQTEHPEQTDKALSQQRVMEVN